MKNKGSEGVLSRKVLATMIFNTELLKEVASKWERGWFDSPTHNFIGCWCVDYYKQYGKAPGLTAIKDFFRKWAKRQDWDDIVVRAMEQLINRVADEQFEIIHGDPIKKAEDFFREQQRRWIKDDIEAEDKLLLQQKVQG